MAQISVPMKASIMYNQLLGQCLGEISGKKVSLCTMHILIYNPKLASIVMIDNWHKDALHHVTMQNADSK
jgi:hypothetical protein